MSSKIVAKYAKSGKSSCKKCSEKIASKSLKLGLKSPDPRGFDSVKWHHFSCFFALDSVSFGLGDVEGLSRLTADDQDKLKQMVSEGDQSSTKRDGDVETDLDTRDSKKLKLIEDGETELQGRDQKSEKRGDVETESDKRESKKLKTHESQKSVQGQKNITKIVAEYAKSKRSSCKKCSEKIEFKSLRLGMSSWDPRGFVNTKWYHSDCFFPLDADLTSPESIEGFTELKASDQEKLKKLVTEGVHSSKKADDQDKLKQMVSEGDQSSTKREGDVETDLNPRDLKKLKTHESEETVQEKKNLTKEKIVANYAKSGRSSCKKCSETIGFKSLRLGTSSWDPRGFEHTKWYHLDCFFPLDADLTSPESIEGFTELKVSDQEKLKKLVTEGGQSSKKLTEDGETELQGRDQKSEKRGDVETESDKRESKKLKTHESRKSVHDKKNITKIVAKYAQSGRSSCKKCSEKIQFKSLRLGMSHWDPRGFENTKWYHSDCFFPLDADLTSPESIEGLTELKASDQEKLKKLVTEGGHSSKKADDQDNLKQMVSEGDQSSTKIIAEYAKSGRSSCKKCSENIGFKSLRLGTSSWDLRGFEHTKWYHLDCFFPLDEDLTSPESIEGFTELKVSDQEKLKKLVTEGGQSSKKLIEDGETELQGRDQKSEKRGGVETEADKRAWKKLKTHESQKSMQDKKIFTKIVADYAKSRRSSCKKCSEKIEFKSLRLGMSNWDPRGFENPKWYHPDCFFPLDADLTSPESIEGLTELKASDQEKLKKLVTEGIHSSKKVDDQDKLKQMVSEGDQSSTKIIAEYAKSGRSSCKKCSENIGFESLRLGTRSWDPRGFEHTKWYHLDCFLPLDADLTSPESIEGFTELKVIDQEKLKKLVTEGGQSSKKLIEDSETELQGRDQKSEKREGDVETESDKRESKKLKVG